MTNIWKFLQLVYQLLGIFVWISCAWYGQMLISNLSVVVKLAVYHLLKRNGREVNNGVSSLIFVFETIFELFMEVWHCYPQSWSIDPTWMHGNKLAMSGIQFGKLFINTELLSLVPGVLRGPIILFLFHIQVISDKFLC